MYTNSISYRKARTQHDKISLWLTCSTYHNFAEKKNKTMSINYTTTISTNYTTNSSLLRFCVPSSTDVSKSRRASIFREKQTRKNFSYWNRDIRYFFTIQRGFKFQRIQYLLWPVGIFQISHLCSTLEKRGRSSQFTQKPATLPHQGSDKYSLLQIPPTWKWFIWRTHYVFRYDR